MGVLALVDAFAYVAGHDFTGDTNMLQLATQAEAKDRTTFGSGGWREFAGGVKSHQFAMHGFWQSAAADAVDPEAFPDLAVADRVFTFGPVETEGQPAYMFQSMKTRYVPFAGPHGELAGFELDSVGSNGVGVIRGQLAAAKGVRTSLDTGPHGSAVNLGAPTSTQFVYAVLHVFSVGTSITVGVESDATGGGSFLPRGTFGPITTRGGTWMTRIAGSSVPAGEAFWRFQVDEITGDATIAGAIAVA